MSDLSPGNTLSDILRIIQEATPLIAKAWWTPHHSLDAGGGFQLIEGDLSDATAANFAPSVTGYGLRFLKRGSHLGARFEVELGGVLRSFAPGDEINGYFKSVRFRKTPDSASAGPYRIQVLSSPLANYHEASQVGVVTPIALLGTLSPSGVPTYVAVAKDTDPAGATPAGSFDATGFNNLVVLVDGASAAANAVSFDLVPWFDPSRVGTNWHSQDVDRVSVPAPDADTEFRAAVMQVAGRGLMYLAVRNLLAAGRTGLGLCVLGVE